MATKTNFGDLPESDSGEDSKVVILPVPYDGTSTWIKGADKGPDAIIDASANMELYDIESDSEPYKIGIFTEKAISEKSSPEKMVEAVEKKVNELLTDDKFVVILGGEHSVSIGAFQAHKKKFKNLSVLQFDAHSDLRSEYHGSKNNHACVMARAKDLCPIVQVGIRSMDISEKKNMDKSRVFFAHDIKPNDERWMDEVAAKLTDDVYITIDLDVFDPAFMPSTGTPEPGGLNWYQVTETIKRLSKKKNIVGLDIVELCPNKIDKAPDFLAAKLIYKILSYKFGGKK